MTATDLAPVLEHLQAFEARILANIKHELAPTSGFLSKENACKYLAGIDLKTFDRLIKAGEIPAYPISPSGKTKGYKIADLDAWAMRFANHNGRDNRKVKSHE